MDELTKKALAYHAAAPCGKVAVKLTKYEIEKMFKRA